MSNRAGFVRAGVVRAGARGLVAAMAMTGLRAFTSNAGLLHTSPPEAIIEQQAPRWSGRFSPRRRTAIEQLAHWAYGAAGGVVFGLLPQRVRIVPPVGALYGLSIWLGFELAIAPVLGVRHTGQNRLVHRSMLALDHVMYGIVVAGRLAPPPEARMPGGPSDRNEDEAARRGESAETLGR